MGPASGDDDDDRTMQLPHAPAAQPEPYDRLTHAAPESDEKPTVVAASPSQSMLLVADPLDDELSAPHASEPHPADDEPNTMLTQAPDVARDEVAREVAREDVVREVVAREVVAREVVAETAPPPPHTKPESRPRIPTPRMDLRQYTPASIGPTALTLAPPTPSSMPRRPFPLPQFDMPEPLPARERARLHPVAWIAVGMLLGAAAMAGALRLRASSNGAPASANVPVETDLDTVAPMPSARPAASAQRK